MSIDLSAAQGRIDKNKINIVYTYFSLAILRQPYEEEEENQKLARNEEPKIITNVCVCFVFSR